MEASNSVLIREAEPVSAAGALEHRHNIHLSDPEAAPLIAGGHSSAAPSSSSASLHHHHSRSASRGHLPGSSSLAGPFTGSGLVRSASGAGLDGGGDAAATRGAADDERPWVTIAGHSFSKRIVLVVVISALGYFVDVYDLLQFSILRVPSLRSLGLPPQRVTSAGILLLNLQMAGMLLGGVVFGVLGDRLGRVKVLFASILTYSLANIFNSFVTTVGMYGLFRFLAGFGLSGELGAAITLVAETMPKDSRGLGTTVVAAFGVLGACFAALIGDRINWRVAYVIGGLMGLVLLVLRVSILESGMFVHIAAHDVPKGDLTMLIRPRERLIKYARCCLLGAGNWYCIGILITFCPELTAEMGVRGTVKASLAILWMYLGLSVGDALSGLVSQHLKSRRKVLFGFLSFSSFMSMIYLVQGRSTTAGFYCSCFFLGISCGYWVLFVTVAAENFGVNLRNTVTTSVPNFVRASTILYSTLFHAMSGMGLRWSAALTGMLAFALAFYSLHGLQETFGRELSYLELHHDDKPGQMPLSGPMRSDLQVDGEIEGVPGIAPLGSAPDFGPGPGRPGPGGAGGARSPPQGVPAFETPVAVGGLASAGHLAMGVVQGVRGKFATAGTAKAAGPLAQ